MNLDAYRSFACAMLFFVTGSAFADDGIDFFEREIRPVLVEHCYECHSSEAEKLRGNLYLDSQSGWQIGGDSGPVLVPGKPGESLLIKAIQYADEDLEMPPRQKLPPKVIEAFTRWIEMGAPDPRNAESTNRLATSEIDLTKGREFWSFQPVNPVPVPEVADSSWPANEIDHFILARLENEKLAPAGPADPDTLLRRLFVNLTGLPPSPDDIIAFRKNPDLPPLLDRVLDSPQFGERWGRHWLDLARYADSTGGGASNILPDAWKYRDYVVRSFNENKPYDQFVTEQLAGDLIPHKDIAEHFDHLAATGFLVLGPKNYINDDGEAFHMDSADEQVDTVGRVFLGMTLGCARCHDHKFDPVPMEDYYALAGIFTSTETSDPIPATTNFTWNEIGDPHIDPDGAALNAYEIANAEFRTLAKKYSRGRTDASIKPEELERIGAARDAARERTPKKPPVIMAVTEASPEKIGDTHLRIRGNPHQLAEKVPRGFLRVTLPEGGPPQPVLPSDQSGRLELAQWVTAPGNPLAARVYVNRVWTHLMGRGIVSTPDNFGVTGAPPSHPELLDWLANWFIENGQSTKKLIRLIVSSKVWQLGPGEPGSSLLEKDPANRLFGRRTPRSLDAETLRDAILQAAGTLVTDGGDAPFPPKLKSELDYDFATDFRRSVYLPRFRNHLPEMLESFDVANPAMAVGQRDSTILPTQALYLMNNAFITEQAEIAAQKLLELPESDRIRRAWLTSLGRDPSAEEIAIVEAFLFKGETQQGKIDDQTLLSRWTAIQQNLFSCVDFRFLK